MEDFINIFLYSINNVVFSYPSLGGVHTVDVCMSITSLLISNQFFQTHGDLFKSPYVFATACIIYCVKMIDRGSDMPMPIELLKLVKNCYITLKSDMDMSKSVHDVFSTEADIVLTLGIDTSVARTVHDGIAKYMKEYICGSILHAEQVYALSYYLAYEAKKECFVKQRRVHCVDAICATAVQFSNQVMECKARVLHDGLDINATKECPNDLIDTFRKKLSISEM